MDPVFVCEVNDIHIVSGNKVGSKVLSFPILAYDSSLMRSLFQNIKDISSNDFYWNRADTKCTAVAQHHNNDKGRK